MIRSSARQSQLATTRPRHFYLPRSAETPGRCSADDADVRLGTVRARTRTSPDQTMVNMPTAYKKRATSHAMFLPHFAVAGQRLGTCSVRPIDESAWT